MGKNVIMNPNVCHNIILNDELIRWAKKHSLGGRFVLQQNCAPAHGSKSTIVFCEQNCPDVPLDLKSFTAKGFVELLPSFAKLKGSLTWGMAENRSPLPATHSRSGH